MFMLARTDLALDMLKKMGDVELVSGACSSGGHLCFRSFYC